MLAFLMLRIDLKLIKKLLLLVYWILNALILLLVISIFSTVMVGLIVFDTLWGEIDFFALTFFLFWESEVEFILKGWV